MIFDNIWIEIWDTKDYLGFEQIKNDFNNNINVVKRLFFLCLYFVLIIECKNVWYFAKLCNHSFVLRFYHSKMYI